MLASTHLFYMLSTKKQCGRNKHGYLSISPTYGTEAQLLAMLNMAPSLIQENN